MNTAASLVTASLLPVAVQAPSDPAMLLAPGTDFTAAMAAACLAEPEAALPEDMQSAAALAWLAGLAGAVKFTPPQPGTDMPADSNDAPAAEVHPVSDVLPVATLSLLHGMFAPMMQDAPRHHVAGSETASAVFSAADAQRAVSLTAGVVNTNTNMTASSPDSLALPDVPLLPGVPLTAEVATPLPLVRGGNAAVQPNAPAAAQGIDIALASTADVAALTDAAPAKSSMGERLVGALAERISMRVEAADSAGFHTEVDRSSISGTNPYASTREIVVNQAGAVSTRPEVVHSTVGSPRWANELGSRLAMMSVRGQQEGSLSLTPEHLGPLEVRISVNQDSTNVWFGAQHADTRAALADAMPRLREMFATAGLELGHTGVSHEMPGQEARRGEAAVSGATADSEPTEPVPVKAARVVTGLLDTWA
jgi:flagellar hook-length control protein FliK